MLTAALEEEVKSTDFIQSTFVIGVKNDELSDLDLFLKNNPIIKVVTRYPDMPNTKYDFPQRYHILQPAFLRRML